MRDGRVLALALVLVAPAIAPARAAEVEPSQQAPRLVLVDDEAELEKALAARTPPRGFPVRVAGFSVPADDPSAVRLVITAAVDDQREGMALASVAYAVLSDKGERVSHVVRRGELHRSPAGPFSFAEIVTVPPGTYRLRFAVMRDGRVAGDEAAVVARVQSTSSVRVGDLIVGDVMADEVLAAATPERHIQGGRLVATLPLLIAAGAPSGVAVRVEIATEAGAAALLTAPLSIAAGEGHRLAQAPIDARLLPPGNYVGRAIVSVAGREMARATAPLTIDRPAGGTAGETRPAPRAGAPGTAAFRLEDVFDAGVVGPFLDELVSRTPAAARPAIEQARAGRFVEAALGAKSKSPDDPSGSFLQGLALLSQRQLQPASQAFRDTLKAAPDYFVGAFYIGACYAAGGRDQQAVNAWQTSLVGLEQYPVVFRLLADALLRLGQSDRAAQTLDEASGKWPDDRDLRLRFLRAALEARQFDRAIASADAALARLPVDAEVLFLGMQAIFARATQGPGGASDDVDRFKRYRDAYAASGGSQPLVAEWLTALEKKVPAAR